MKFESFISGVWMHQFQYKSFLPTPINQEWCRDDKEVNTSSRIEGTRTERDEAVQEESAIRPERCDDWREVRNYVAAMVELGILQEETGFPGLLSNKPDPREPGRTSRVLAISESIIDKG